ncbi:hypothetical protein J4429_02790 [Candidatus Pacearchaeota archaeon]|nr:hypothetical protein [Candidatus Pacearchaeota archaeon]
MPEKEDNFGRRLRNRAKRSYELAGEKFENATESSREVVREHPLTSVVIAAAVGAIVGVGVNEMIRRARHRDRKSFVRRLRRMF